MSLIPFFPHFPQFHFNSDTECQGKSMFNFNNVTFSYWLWDFNYHHECEKNTCLFRKSFFLEIQCREAEASSKYRIEMSYPLLS